MCKLLTTFLFCFVLLTKSYATTGREIETTINQLQKLIDKKEYVTAFHLLSEKEKAFKESHERFALNYLASQIVEVAAKQTGKEYYIERYFSILEEMCNYFLANTDRATTYNQKYLWNKVEELSNYYAVREDSKIVSLFASIDKIAFKNVINGYLIYQNYYNYLIAKSDYGMAGMNMQTLAYKLMDTKADSLSIASAAYLGAIGYLTNTQEFKETDLFGISIIKNLNKANEIYSSHSLLSQSVDAIHILGDYAVYYYIIGDKEKAAKLQLEEKKKILQQFGSKGLEYAWMLSREGVIYHIMDEEEKAKACWIEAYNISSTLVQNKKEQYKFNIIQNNYNKCFGFFEEKPAPQIKSLSYYVDRIKNIPTLTISESNKSYQLIEFLPGLETLSPFPTETYLECIFAIHKLSMNSDSETDEFVALPNDLANTLNSFRNDSNMSENDINGILGQRNPNLNRMCILQAIFTLTQKEVITNETYSELLILLAETYLKEEKWEHAEVVLKEVISKYKDTKATNLKQLYATALLGKCYAKLYKTELCKEILEKLQKKLVRLEKGSYQTEQYISIHNSMADIYLCIGNHKAMFTYSDKIVELSKNRFDFLPYLYESIYRKALYLYEKGEYATCVELLMHVCEADYRIDNIKELNGILIRSLCQTNNPKAYSFLERYMNRVVKEFIPQYFAGKSQFLRDEFWGNQATQIIELNTEVARTFPNQKVLISAYNNVLFTKSLDVRYEQSMRETIKTADSYNQDLYAKMKAAQDSLHFGNPANSLLYKNFIAFAQSILNNYFIEAEVANIENKQFFRKVQNIEENRAIVEFVMIPHNNEPYYFAYITEKEKHFPILIEICSSGELLPYINQEKTVINELYGSSDLLYRKIWEKIEKQLNKNINEITLVPTGILNRINFNAIPTSYGRVSDKFNVMRASYTVSSTEHASYREKCDFDIALFGGVTYNLSVDKIVKESRNYVTLNKDEQRSFDTDRSKIGFLPNSQLEIDQISELYDSAVFRIKKVNRELASEAFFKGLSGRSPLIIHLATHGFYLKSPEAKSSYSFYNAQQYSSYYKERSLLYSGLLMAGAQQAWSGNELPAGVEDGILTADEISRLDLSNTRLAVLSACDTALGDIHETEGVLGLQRAFKKAGVHAVVMSLWSVGDKQTALLMSHLHRNLQIMGDLNVALQCAMNEVRKTYPDPVHWAGFVAIK